MVVVVAAFAFVLAPVLVLTVHECAHALAALSVRAPSVRLRLGTRSRAWGAHVEAELPDSRLARAWFFAAGPVANVALAVSCLEMENAFVRALGLLSALFAFVSVVGSDGRGVVRAIWSTSAGPARNDDAQAVR